MSETAQNSEKSNSIPVQPIVLTKPANSNEANNFPQGRRGFLATFAVLFAGWLVGNLILLSVLGLGAVWVVGSTGLVEVPFLTSYLFGDTQPTTKVVDTYSLHNGEEKLNKIQDLSEDETLNSLVFYEDEINALLINRANQDPNFPINWENLQLQHNEFIFSGKISSTNAPVQIRGKISTQGLSGSIEITEAKYGRISIPSFIATNIVENQLSFIGLSLSNNRIPAKAIEISPGLIKLTEVTKIQ